MLSLVRLFQNNRRRQQRWIGNLRRRYVATFNIALSVSDM